MKNTNKRNVFLAITGIAIVGLFAACDQPKVEKKQEQSIVQVQHPEWSKNLSVYEVNVRQFTSEGTFLALESHLPRLKNLGADILWLMPINPIGETNRKGTLGSYYSIKDYREINPEYGNKEDFKHFVEMAHEQGLYVIVDWVANHSAWDNALVTEHPDWYDKDSTGKMVSPFDWTDVVEFNYNNPDMSAYMLDALKYWVIDFNIDGYRCDVAGMVPDSFWQKARTELDGIKPVFMLAEDEAQRHHAAFDMTYGWEFHHIMNKIYKGENTANDIEIYLKKNDSLYPENAYRMNFITNHDENSWNGTEFERLGKGVEAFYVLTATVPGMPLIYTGQESAMDKRLDFFERDPVKWGDYSMTSFYKALFDLKKSNAALYNGSYGGSWERINTVEDSNVFALLRKKDNNAVVSIVNLSKEAVKITLKGSAYIGEFTQLYSGEKVTLSENQPIELPAWGYKVFYK
ncbi:MAG: alpha-amylase family glycosyl hydrolase [Lentimicrobium sp.]|jgi:glycosidase|nr:alpha-amylase family glycosyl hydrolase [Lentimicrobium sp.]